MFSFLKDKLKSVISRISKKIEEEPKEEVKEETQDKIEIKTETVGQKEDKIKSKEQKKELKEKKQLEKEVKQKQKIEKSEEKEIVEEPEKQEIKEEKRGFFSKLKEKLAIKKEEPEKPKEEAKLEDQIEEKKGFFGLIKEKITTTKISEDKFEELFNELEITLLENNVALEVVEKIKEDLKKDIVEKPIKRGEVENKIKSSLKKSIEDLFLVPNINLIDLINNKKEKPFVLCFVGINGSGKTTSIAKTANLLRKNNLSVVLAASDTFRAASIEQLKEWGNKLNVKVIAHDYKSDPAAVSFDAIKYAQAHNIDVVLIDTAGRLHSNVDLMREMEKIVRVAKPDLKIFVGEAITGNDCVEQCKEFNNAIGIDGIILAKADIDEKGGAMVSTSFVTHKPIIYLGTGQNIDDLKEFNKEEIISSIGL